jgi:chromosome segregation ATPase
MEKKAAEKVELDKECTKLEKSIDKYNKKYAEVRDNIIAEEDKLEEIRNEIKDMEAQKIELANELADYVKQKLDIKDRKDKLDAKEKYLRKRFEEAGIDF